MVRRVLGVLANQRTFFAWTDGNSNKEIAAKLAGSEEA